MHHFRDPHFGLFEGLGLLLGYLATSDAKYDVTFQLSDPDFLYGWRNFASISRSFRDLMRDRQTADRQTRRPKQKALTLSVRG